MRRLRRFAPSRESSSSSQVESIVFWLSLCTALALLHLKFRDAMPVEEKVRVLGPRRLEEIVNGVVEADIPWKDALLDAISPKDLVARSPQQTVDAIVARARG